MEVLGFLFSVLSGVPVVVPVPVVCVIRTHEGCASGVTQLKGARVLALEEQQDAFGRAGGDGSAVADSVEASNVVKPDLDDLVGDRIGQERQQLTVSERSEARRVVRERAP
ncbi:hypothetical protein ACWF9B_27545 [Streptomyces sp. NPDC055089]